MSYQRFAAHAPELRTLTCGAIEEADEVMHEMIGWDLELRQLDDGPFRSDLTVAKIGKTVFLWQRFNRAVQTVLHPPEGLEVLVLPIHDGGKIRLSGDNLANNEVLVMPKGSEADLVSGHHAGTDCIFLPEGRLTGMLETLRPTPVSLKPRKAAIVHGNKARMQAIHKAIARLIAETPSRGARKRVDHLVTEAIAWMGESSSHWRLEGSTVNRPNRRTAKQAQKIIETRYRRPVRLDDLCCATGVGMRSLQRSFHDYFSLTITDYLKAVRLNGARRELVAADPGSTTVSAIARKNGIPHPGRFSVEFRKRFGECPSEVLAEKAAPRRRRSAY